MATQDTTEAGTYFFTYSVTKQEQRMRLEREMGNGGNTGDAIQGMIAYPCCPKETIIVYRNTHGQASAKCPKCGKYARFDYDLMQAQPSTPIRGASRIYKKV